ncbi:PLC-like phosphodiesterase [Amanita muscaria]
MVYGAWSLFATYISLFANKPSDPVHWQYFDLQGHRGGRGDVIENTLPSFAWALVSGVTTLELDNGITRDGVPIVWHDEAISADKCEDTSPAFIGDPDFPYVGKSIANLTLTQIKMLDCGSKRSNNYPLQLRYPGTKISTLRELFEFASCADPDHRMLWNIESKINPVTLGATLDVDDFVTKQHAEFIASGYAPSQITYQSFDWRTLVAMKALDDRFPVSALIDEDSVVSDAHGISPWLAGLHLEGFPGSMDVQIAHAAKYINADILSPAAFYENGTSHDPSLPGYIPFATRDMVDRAHDLGMLVVPWTVNRLNIADELLDWGVDGIITDYPNTFYRWAKSRNLKVAPQYSEKEVMFCLRKHLQTV